MMLKNDYRKLFDSISPDPTLEQRTEKEIMEMLNPKTKRNLRRTLCIAVAAALLTIGAAFAAVTASGILERLFPDGNPSQQAVEAVVRNPGQVSSEGITLQIDEYLIDHNSLHIDWTVSSQREKDVFYTTGYEFIYSNPEDALLAENSIGGNYGGYSSGEIGDSILAHLSRENPTFSGCAGYGYSGSLTGPIEARIYIRAYETDYKLVDVESALDLAYVDAGDPASIALENAGQIGVSPDHMTSINGYSAFNAAFKKLMDEGMEWDAAHEAALAESGIFKEVASLETTLIVDPGTAVQPHFSMDEETSFQVSDATVLIKSFSVDVASTVLEYEVITDKVLDEENIIGNGVTYILFDQDGNPLNSDYALGMSGGQLNDRDGKHVYHVSVSGNPLPESIVSITFVPTANLERQQGESSNAYFLRMKEQADAAQCFTIDIR